MKTIIRLVTHAGDGTLRIKDYRDIRPVKQLHVQVGLDNCSIDPEVRGYPLFRGLIGPMPEGEQVVRYESPAVFEILTMEWTSTPRIRPFALDHSPDEFKSPILGGGWA